MDHFVLRELLPKQYVRYVDDFLLFGDDKRILTAMREAIDRFLNDGLRVAREMGWSMDASRAGTGAITVAAGAPFSISGLRSRRGQLAPRRTSKGPGLAVALRRSPARAAPKAPSRRGAGWPAAGYV